MNELGLLLGHLVGDYIVQNDWMAKHKIGSFLYKVPSSLFPGFKFEFNWTGTIACTIHCLFYTLSIWLFSFSWMPWWGLLVCFVLHWPIDRFRLARLWMIYVAGQKDFATGPLSPWSIILVDNIFHLLTLYGIGVIYGSL